MLTTLVTAEWPLAFGILDFSLLIVLFPSRLRITCSLNLHEGHNLFGCSVFSTFPGSSRTEVFPKDSGYLLPALQISDPRG